MKQRRWSRGEKWLLGSSCALCLSGLAISWVYERQNELPPPPSHVEEVPPANNAFDSILQAVALAPAGPRPRQTANGCQSDIDPYYGCDSNFQKQLYTPQYNYKFPLTRKIAYLKKAQNSLKLWHGSLADPVYVTLDLSLPSSDSQYRLWEQRGRLMSLARLQAHACWQRGDNTGALEWLLDSHREACRTAKVSGHQYPSNWVYQLEVSEKQRVTVLNELEQLSPYLNSTQARHAAMEMQRNRSLLPSRVEILEKSKEVSLERAYRMCTGERKAESSDYDRVWDLKFRWTNKKAGLARIKRQWDWLIEQEKLPLTKQYSTDNKLPNDVFMEEYDPFWKLSFQNRAQIREHGSSLGVNTREVVWETAMAVRAFELEWGCTPRTLSELVPNYLKKTEHDPFDASHLLRYSPRAKTYKQWYMGRPIYTKPLPPDAISAPSWEVSPPGVRSIEGYHVASVIYKLPFVLYSVGENGLDEGGKDFKWANTRPNFTEVVSNSVCDDILASAEWFTKRRVQDSNRYFVWPPPA